MNTAAATLRDIVGPLVEAIELDDADRGTVLRGRLPDAAAVALITRMVESSEILSACSVITPGRSDRDELLLPVADMGAAILTPSPEPRPEPKLSMLHLAKRKVAGLAVLSGEMLDGMRAASFMDWLGAAIAPAIARDIASVILMGDTASEDALLAYQDGVVKLARAGSPSAGPNPDTRIEIESDGLVVRMPQGLVRAAIWRNVVFDVAPEPKEHASLRIAMEFGFACLDPSLVSVEPAPE